MRKGFNPNKDKSLQKSVFWHQIVIPVYIPNENGYFQDSFKILKRCLESIFATVHPQTYVSIVNNGSSEEVSKFLTGLNKAGKINELINTTNIGKLNAINKGIIGQNFPIITIADADVLFLPGWQKETIKVFEKFPKAGTVGIVPQYNMYANFCTNVIFDNFFNQKMHFYKVGEPESMRKFYQSLNWKMQNNHYYLKYILATEKGGVKACVGSGHFVATYRKELFDDLKRFIPAKMGAASERLLDKAAMDVGLWKLTTFNNYALHMGNVYEAWMDEIEPGDKRNIKEVNKPNLRNPSYLSYFVKNKLFKKLMRVKIINDLFFKYKKLPPELNKQYSKVYY